MYSMYVDYINKVRETLNRPRFFYINLIEPKVYNYYSNIVKAYEELLVINNKVKYIYLCMLILKWNNIRKNNIQDLKNKYIIPQFNKFIANKSSFNSYLNYKYLLMKSYNLLYKKNEKLNINNNTGIMSKDINGDIVKVNNNVDKTVFKRRIYKKILNSKKKKY